jgi:hypothetical protein
MVVMRRHAGKTDLQCLVAAVAVGIDNILDIAPFTHSPPSAVLVRPDQMGFSTHAKDARQRRRGNRYAKSLGLRSGAGVYPASSNASMRGHRLNGPPVD